jgi:hypothetical protein
MVDLVHGMVDHCFGWCTVEQGQGSMGSSPKLDLVAAPGHAGPLRQRGNEEGIAVVLIVVEWRRRGGRFCPAMRRGYSDSTKLDDMVARA